MLRRNLIDAVPAGTPVNVAAQVARLGGRARLLAGISTDSWGALLTKALVTLGLVALPNATALAIVQLSESGDRSFRFFRNDTADLAVKFDQLDQTAYRLREGIRSSRCGRFFPSFAKSHRGNAG